MGEPLFNLARFVEPPHLNLSPPIPSIKWSLESATASIKTGIRSAGVGLSPLQSVSSVSFFDDSRSLLLVISLSLFRVEIEIFERGKEIFN